jgi:hypothetical protein
MGAGSFRFGVGTFECVSVSDGAFNCPTESLFSNVPLERLEEALRHLYLPTSRVTTPYTCLYIDTGNTACWWTRERATWEHTRPRCSSVSTTRRPLRACWKKT